MKTRIILIVFFAALAAGCRGTSQAAAAPKKLMAHYMPWYQSQFTSGYWGWHWHMNHFSPPDTLASHYRPLFGPYDSSDPHVLASQALLMKFAGIDGMIADWYGIESFWDYGRVRDATNKFIPYIKKAGLEFAICYEDQSIKHMLSNDHFDDRAEAVAHGVEVMEWLESRYFADASYLKIDGRPVLLCFGPQFFSAAEWAALFAVVDPKPHFFPLHYHYVPAPTATGEFNWPEPAYGATSVVSRLNAFYSRADVTNWDHFLAAAFPRFHDIYAEAGGNSYGYIGDEGDYGSGGTSTYAYTLQRGLESDADIVQLVTWNDYGEGTIIEPTEEDGYRFLETTQAMRKAHLDPAFPYTAADLRLPVRLFTLRTANRANPSVMIRLDAVEDDLFADNLTAAKKAMDQIECTDSLAGDLDGDCRVNSDDLLALALAWLSTPASGHWDPACDLALPPDEVINLRDFAVYAEHWLIGNRE